MKTTVYEVKDGQRSWMWDSRGETADLRHLDLAFGLLANNERYYEVEQDGKVVMTVKKEGGE